MAPYERKRSTSWKKRTTKKGSYKARGNGYKSRVVAIPRPINLYDEIYGTKVEAHADLINNNLSNYGHTTVNLMGNQSAGGPTMILYD